MLFFLGGDIFTETITKIGTTVPISMFNNGMADEIFEEVRHSGTKVVMKNDLPECVLMSPEDYVKMSDVYNDAKLLALAEERWKNFDRSRLISQNACRSDWNA